MVAGGALVTIIALIALSAPLIAGDPVEFDPPNRLKRPSAEHRFGTDNLGRDVYARTVHGTRVSLLVGLTVATISIAVGLTIGLIAGYVQWLDGSVMRVMDA